MDTNPYSSPTSDVPQYGPSTASRIRRRLLGLVLILVGCVLFMLRDMRPITATLLSPTLGFYGLSGVLYPLAVPDPKREFGVMQAWIDFGRKEARVGFAALGLGFLCGLAMLFV
jgi:hypothetical protein